MNIEDTINEICGKLPVGYTISINMEQGAAWIEIVDSYGDYACDDGIDLSDTMPQRLLTALDIVTRHSAAENN